MELEPELKGDVAVAEACELELDSEPNSNVVVAEALRVDDAWEPKLDDAVFVGARIESSEVDVGAEPPRVSVPPPTPSHVSPVGQQPLGTQYSPFGQ